MRISRCRLFGCKPRHVENLESENRRLKTEINLQHNMVGHSPRMRAVYEFVAKVAPTGSTALIGGESGTGKELAARAIHRNSPRSGKPFVAINCAALTESLTSRSRGIRMSQL